MALKGERMVIFSRARQAGYTDDYTKLKDPFDHIDRPSLERLDLVDLPLCRKHERNHVIGKTIYQHGGRETDKYTISFIDGTKVIGNYVINHELMKGGESGLRDVSIGFDVMGIVNEENPRQMPILKFPREISLVQQGLAPGTEIICAMTESELKTKAAEYISKMNSQHLTAPNNANNSNIVYSTNTEHQWIGSVTPNTMADNQNLTGSNLNGSQPVVVPQVTPTIPQQVQNPNVPTTNQQQQQQQQQQQGEMTLEQLEKIAISCGLNPNDLKNIPRESLPLMMKLAMDLYDTKNENKNLKTDQNFLKKQAAEFEENIKKHAFELAKSMVGETKLDEAAEIVNTMNPFLTENGNTNLAEMLQKGKVISSVLAYGNNLRDENERIKAQMKKMQEEEILKQSQLQKDNHGNNYPAQNNVVGDPIETFLKSRSINNTYKSPSLSFTGSRFNPMQVTNAEKKPAAVPATTTLQNQVPQAQTQVPVQQNQQSSIPLPQEGSLVRRYIEKDPEAYARFQEDSMKMTGAHVSNNLMERLANRFSSAPNFDGMNGTRELSMQIDRPSKQTK